MKKFFNYKNKFRDDIFFNLRNGFTWKMLNLIILLLNITFKLQKKIVCQQTEISWQIFGTFNNRIQHQAIQFNKYVLTKTIPITEQAGPLLRSFLWWASSVFFIKNAPFTILSPANYFNLSLSQKLFCILPNDCMIIIVIM